MSLNSLINEQIKQVLNRNTNNVIETITKQLNVSKITLVDIWNNLNTEFSIKYKPSRIFIPEIIDEDITISQEYKIEIIDEDFYPEIKLEIIDENL